MTSKIHVSHARMLADHRQPGHDTGQSTRLTHVNVGHHLFGRDGGLVAPYHALVDVGVEPHTLEATQQEHDRNGHDGQGG